MKKGVTVSILALTIVLMSIIVGIVGVVGAGAIKTANYEEFTSKLTRVHDEVNKYVIQNKTIPTTNEIISKQGLDEALTAELSINNDTNNNLFVVDISKLKLENVNIGKGTIEDLDVFIVAENTNNIYYLKGINYKSSTYHSIKLESKDPENNIPETWRKSVVAIEDGVPIPKGFTASKATGENKKHEGFVIYEGLETVDDTNVESARRSRNQYVWIPVEQHEFTTKFIRSNFGLSCVISNVIGQEFWEIEIDEETNMPLETQSDITKLREIFFAEIKEIYASVRKYGGFYIARYEAGTDVVRDENSKNIIDDVYFVMGKKPYNYVATSVTQSLARTQYTSENNYYGVISTPVYGVQHDTIAQWFLDTEAISTVTKSGTYGNYYDKKITLADVNEGAQFAEWGVINEGTEDEKEGLKEYTNISEDTTKTSGTKWALTTGALKVAKVNNIYDLAGNMGEVTAERSRDVHCYRRRAFYSRW